MTGEKKFVAVAAAGLTRGLCGCLTGNTTAEGKLEVEFQGGWVGYYWNHELVF